MDMRTEGVGERGAKPWRLTRVEDEERWKKLDEVEEQKLELEDEV